jgi:hypothetical protein
MPQWLKPTQAFMTKWWAYIDWCLNADLQAPVCRPFWSWVMIALLAVGALIVIWAVVKYIAYGIKLAAALRAEAYRMGVADAETIKAHAWEGDNAYPSEGSSEEARRRIKDALVERQNQGRPPPVV